MMVRAMVLAAPGVNCDRETVEGCRLAGADAELVHLNQLIQRERCLDDFGLLILPGGFSYGDHLGAGAMLATILRHRFLDDLRRFVADGRPVLGICNGFQVLARLGLLGDVALAPNSAGRFECRWVRLRTEASPCIFLRGLGRFELPIAHGQGRVVISAESPSGRHPGGTRGRSRRAAGTEPPTYRDGPGEFLAPLRYCENPNGSMADIAGVCNADGNVLGLMPHPERYLTPYHHPAWTRPDRTRGAATGLALFQNAVRYVREEL